MKQKIKKIITNSIFVISNSWLTPAIASTYEIVGVFAEPVTVIGHTTFTGTFDWDAVTETVSGLHGTQNVTMYDPSQYPDLSLNYQLDQSVDGNIVTASVFLKNTTDVFMYGGYATGGSYKYGISFDPNYNGDLIPNKNAYFTLHLIKRP